MLLSAAILQNKPDAGWRLRLGGTPRRWPPCPKRRVPQAQPHAPTAIGGIAERLSHISGISLLIRVVVRLSCNGFMSGSAYLEATSALRRPLHPHD